VLENLHHAFPALRPHHFADEESVHIVPSGHGGRMFNIAHSFDQNSTLTAAPNGKPGAGSHL